MLMKAGGSEVTRARRRRGKISNSNDRKPSTNRSGLVRFSLSFGACACVRRCALARALVPARARECRAEARMAHSAPRAWGRTHKPPPQTYKRQEISVFIRHQLWFSQSLVSVLREGERQQHCLYFYWGSTKQFRHSGAHGENEGEKPWPKLVGLQRAGRILWPADR